MKLTLRGALRLKPFDETDDHLEWKVTTAAPILTAGLIATSLLCLIALVFAFTGSNNALTVYAVAIMSSAVTAVLQWKAGLKATALNQFWGTLLGSIGITLVLLIVGSTR